MLLALAFAGCGLGRSAEDEATDGEIPIVVETEHPVDTPPEAFEEPADQEPIAAQGTEDDKR